jgi:RNA polymerase sigma-70 factor (ECF subfamily)
VYLETSGVPGAGKRAKVAHRRRPGRMDADRRARREGVCSAARASDGGSRRPRLPRRSRSVPGTGRGNGARAAHEEFDGPMAGPATEEGLPESARAEGGAPADSAGAAAAAEAGLAGRAVRGDREARAALFDRYLDPVYEFVFYRVGRRQEIAEEVTQEVFARALAHMDRFDPSRGDFGQWLGGISRNAIRDLARKSRAPGCALASDPTPVLDGVAGRGDPAGEAADRDGKAALHLALSALPERYRDLLRWKYFDGLSVREIARRRNTTEKSVEGMLGRARAALKDGLGEEMA